MTGRSWATCPRWEGDEPVEVLQHAFRRAVDALRCPLTSEQLGSWTRVEGVRAGRPIVRTTFRCPEPCAAEWDPHGAGEVSCHGQAVEFTYDDA